MMQTNDLIAALAADTRRISPRAAQQRLVVGLGLGMATAAALTIGSFGMRPDLPGALTSTQLWMKAAYTASLAVIAVLAVLHVARPDAGPTRLSWLLLIPVALLASMSAMELMTTPGEMWMPMWLGGSWRQCSIRVVFLAVPIFAALIWSFRQFAPTNLRRAGAAAGLAAGACSATVYGLHCGEVSATFVLTWYSLGIVAATGIGALIGPRLLRW